METNSRDTEILDLFIIGGGVNGCGIARDAAGRGLSVCLAEKDDLASATSSASTKLFHGGLRYLEFLKFRLVREALTEREVLLSAMPHIARPMRFVLPILPGMRFEGGTPVSRLLGLTMPWLKGRRPAWVIRLALLMYDHMGGRKILPPTKALSLQDDPVGLPLKPGVTRAYEYSDVWVDDARLVMLNARDAKLRGAEILTRMKVETATRHEGVWTVTLRDEISGQMSVRQARALVNAAGPWVGQVIDQVVQTDTVQKIRLVRGSHIILPQLFTHDRAYFFQGEDGRIVFAIPYEEKFTLIGTTDEMHAAPDTAPVCSDAEARYLLEFAGRYFAAPLMAEDIVHKYSGVRPLFDDGATSATAATREYVLKLDDNGAPLLNVFGGKITTYRKLAEAALKQLAGHLPMKQPWTAGEPLPGGDFPVDGKASMVQELNAIYPFLTPDWARRLISSYGTDAYDWLVMATRVEDLGQDFGATLTEAELRWMIDQEFAQTVDDVLWRRSKLGLHMSEKQIAAVGRWMKAQSRLARPQK